MIISSKKAIVLACGIATTIAILKGVVIPRISEIAQAAQNKPQVASVAQIAPEQQPAPISSEYTPSLQAAEALKQLTYNQNVWIRQLISCESSGNPGAINPKDKDNTPSYGLMQFKPRTFYGFGKQYGITTTDVMDANQQVEIVVKMIEDRENINWFAQFPDCVRKYGQPPAN